MARLRAGIISHVTFIEIFVNGGVSLKRHELFTKLCFIKCFYKFGWSIFQFTQTIILISYKNTSIGYFDLGIAVAAAGRGVFRADCGRGLVSVFQGFFVSINKIFNLAGGH